MYFIVCVCLLFRIKSDENYNYSEGETQLIWVNLFSFEVECGCVILAELNPHFLRST